MSKGTVKFFNDSKGFGFITEDDNNKEHFVHISGLIDEIREGDAVEFDLTLTITTLKVCQFILTDFFYLLFLS